jgi:hypothetical protein
VKRLEDLSISQLLKVYNAVVENKLKSFKTKGVALERCRAVNITEEQACQVLGLAPAAAPPEKKPRGRRSRVNGEQQIKILKVSERRRDSSRATRRRACYRDGMTVDEFISAVVDSGAGTAQEAKVDLRHDVKVGRISLQ